MHVCDVTARATPRGTLEGREPQYARSMSGSALEEFEARVQYASRLMADSKFADADQHLREAIRGVPEALWGRLPAYERARFDSYRGHCLYELGKYHAALAMIEPAYRARRHARVLDDTLAQQLGDLIRCYRAIGDTQRALALIEEGRSLAGSIPGAAFDAAKFSERLKHEADVIRHTVDNTAQFRVRISGFEGHGVGQFPGALHARIPRSNLEVTCHVERLYVEPLDLNRLFVHLVFSLDNPLPIESWVSDGVYPLEHVPLILALLLPGNARAFSPEHDSFTITPSRPQAPVLEGQHYCFFHAQSYHPNAPHPVPIDRSYLFAEAYAANLRGELPAEARVEFKTTITYYPDAHQRPNLTQKFLLLLPYARTTYDPLPVVGRTGSESIRPAGSTIHVTRFQEDRTSFSPQTLGAFRAPPSVPKVGRSAPHLVAGAETKLELTSTEMLQIELELAPAAQLTLSAAISMPIVPAGIYDLVHGAELISIGSTTLDMTRKPNRIPVLKLIVGNHASEGKAVELSAPATAIFHELQVSEVLAPSSLRTLEFHPRLRLDCPWFAPLLALEDRDAGPHPITLETVVRDLEGPETRSTRSPVKILPPDYMVWWISNDEGASFVDLRHLIARWVTPYCRAIDVALATGQLPAEGKPLSHALGTAYEWLRAKKFSYDNGRLNFGYENEFNYQRVRFPETSLRHRRVNCIDGTVLLASILERLGHSCAVLFVPRHAFLAYSEPVEGGMTITGVETTGLCEQWTQNGNELTFGETTKGRSLSFAEARIVGNIQLKRHAKALFPTKRQQQPATRLNELTAQDDDDPERQERPGRLKRCAVTWIDAARRRDVLPFSFLGGMRERGLKGTP
jgi:tetratricopeptide (TPR) repeat protein